MPKKDEIESIVDRARSYIKTGKNADFYRIGGSAYDEGWVVIYIYVIPDRNVRISASDHADSLMQIEKQLKKDFDYKIIVAAL